MDTGRGVCPERFKIEHFDEENVEPNYSNCNHLCLEEGGEFERVLVCFCGENIPV